MEFAHCIVALAGERDNTVPKYNVTAAEIAVLRAIHGSDAVHDIEPVDPPKVKDEDGKERPVKVKNRDELARLREHYNSPNSAPILAEMFPGMAARVPETIDELGLDDSLFKPKTRETPKSSVSSADAPDRETLGVPRRPAPGEKGSASANEQAEAERDGITPIKDEHADRSVLD